MKMKCLPLCLLRLRENYTQQSNDLNVPLFYGINEDQFPPITMIFPL